MKKTMKNMVAAILAIVLLSVSAIALAEETVEIKNEIEVEVADKANAEETEEAETEETEAKATKKSVKIAVKGTARIGKTIKLKATIKGFENEEYKLQWQTSEDGENWEDVENATKKTLKVKITKANKDNLWRVAVNTAA